MPMDGPSGTLRDWLRCSPPYPSKSRCFTGSWKMINPPKEFNEE